MRERGTLESQALYTLKIAIKCPHYFYPFKIIFIYLFLERGEGRERGRETMCKKHR